MQNGYQLIYLLVNISS